MAAFVAAATFSLGLTACGSDDDSDSTSAETSAGSTTTEAATGSAEDVTVTATEFEFDVSATPDADTKTVNFVNDGKQFHVLVFSKINEGFTVDEAVKLQGKEGSAVDVGTVDAAPGATGKITVKEPLEPGHYVLLCPLSGPEGQHYKLGQLDEFDVE